MEFLLQDLRFSVRTMAKEPGFTVLVAFTLALAMGASITVFNFLDLLKWRQMPAHDSDRLISLWTGDRDPDLDAYDWTSFPDYLYYRDNGAVFSGLLAWMVNLSSLNTGVGTAEWTECWSVTGNYFSLLGVDTAIGRPIAAADDRPAADRVAVLSYELWERRFGRDPGLIGRSVRINGYSFTVIGVARRGFRGNWAARQADMWVPMKNIDVLRSPEIDWIRGSDLRWLGVIGRLRPGVSVSQAQAAVRVLGDQLQRLDPDLKRTRKTVVVAARMVPPRESETLLPRARILGLSVAVLFVISCLNAAILLLLRAIRTQEEMAIRLALGARRGRLLRQLFTQNLLISLLGCAGGLAIGVLGNRLVSSYVTSYSHDLRYDSRVVLFALLIAAAAPLIFGLTPALAASSPALIQKLRGGAAAKIGRVGTASLRKTLVVLEFSLALVLCIGSGLLGRSLVKLRNVDLGFQPDHVLLVQLNLAQKGYSPTGGGHLFQALLDRINRLPEVTSSSLEWLPPFNGITRSVDVELPGLPDSRVAINYNVIGPQFFEVFAIPLVRGRALDRRDGEATPGAIVINQAFADKLWPGSEPVGKSVIIPQLKSQKVGASFEVVGVAADSRYDDISNSRPEPLLYISFPQCYKSAMQLAVRTRGAPAAVLERLRLELSQLDSDLALGDVKTLASQVDSAIWEQRMFAQVSAVLAFLGLAVSVLGIFAVVSFTVSLRKREFGLRLALGARRSDIIRLVLRQAGVLAVAGLVVGLPAAFWAARLNARLLFDVNEFDPWIFSLVPVILVFVALLASYLPASRASKVEPVVALRHG